MLPTNLVETAQEIGGRIVIRECLHDLPGGPVGGGVLSDVEVDDASAMVREHDENEENAQARGGHREEIDRDQVPDMVDEDRPRGLGRLGGAVSA